MGHLPVHAWSGAKWGRWVYERASSGWASQPDCSELSPLSTSNGKGASVSTSNGKAVDRLVLLFSGKSRLVLLAGKATVPYQQDNCCVVLCTAL